MNFFSFQRDLCLSECVINQVIHVPTINTDVEHLTLRYRLWRKVQWSALILTPPRIIFYTTQSAGYGVKITGLMSGFPPKKLGKFQSSADEIQSKKNKGIKLLLMLTAAFYRD